MIYRHKKGGLYARLFTATDSETLEKVVVYLHLFPHKIGIWVRPKKLFDEPDRFRRII